MADKKEGKKFGAGAAKYFKDVKGELKKVVWPSFKQIKNNTIIVIAAVIVVGAFIWALDFAFGTGLDFAIDKINGADTINSTEIGSDSIDMNNIQMVDENGNPINADIVTEGAEIPSDEGETEADGAVEEPAADDAADVNAGADSDGE